MALPVEPNALMLNGDSGYRIERSLRLRGAATAYFSRTPASASNQTTMTLSMWVKRGSLATTLQGLFGAGTSVKDGIQFWNDNIDIYINNGSAYRITTTAVFRDPSAWYHLVFQLDTTQATAANRIRIYSNGVQLTATSGTMPPQNNPFQFNAAVAHQIGRDMNTAQFDGYLAEVNFIDGQSLTPSSFGQTDPITGVWVPKKYAGTYGTNGFYLKFTDNSGATATTIGKDFSGNGNNWTPNNISVTAGATYDSMLDSPTNYADGGNGRGNYPVYNPLVRLGTNVPIWGNLRAPSTGPNNATQATLSMPNGTGKWYAEFQANGTNYPRIGVMDATDTNNNMQGSLTISWGGSGNELFVNGSSLGTGTNYSTEIIGVAVDATTRKVWFSKNGVWQNFSGSGADPATGTNAVGTLAGSSDMFFAVRSEACTIDANFGQRPFSYTPPTGFKALNTQNLPQPSIINGNKYFDATTFTGNGTSQAVVNSGGMQPDLVWIKNRSAAYSHNVVDAVRGSSLYLETNTTAAEVSNSSVVSALNANGFSVGNAPSTNNSGNALVAWQWKEGATPGFDIVTYTGDGSASRNISHSLGAAPKMMIVKWRGGSNNWAVGHTSLTNWNWYLQLNAGGAQTGDATIFPATPTSSVFTVGSSSLSNGNTNGYVAYLWSEVPGFSRFGSYTGNGSADGPFVWCGFRPRFVLYKNASFTTDWNLLDTVRDQFNYQRNILYPNLTIAEQSTTVQVDYLSNGFKVRSSTDDVNRSGSTIVFAAFAENPFKYARAR